MAVGVHGVVMAAACICKTSVRSHMRPKAKSMPKYLSDTRDPKTCLVYAFWEIEDQPSMIGL